MVRMADDRGGAIDVLRATPGVLELLAGALREDLAETPADADWSPRDLVCHLVLAEENGAMARIRAVVSDDQPLLLNWDDEEVLRDSNLRLLPIGVLVSKLADMRKENVAWLAGLAPEAFSRTGRHSEVGKVRGEEFLFHAAYHDSLHISQLARMVGVQFDPLRGALKAY